MISIHGRPSRNLFRRTLSDSIEWAWLKLGIGSFLARWEQRNKFRTERKDWFKRWLTGWWFVFHLMVVSGTPLLNGAVTYANHHLPTPSRPKGRRAQGNNNPPPCTSEKNDKTPNSFRCKIHDKDVAERCTSSWSTSLFSSFSLSLKLNDRF